MTRLEEAIKNDACMGMYPHLSTQEIIEKTEKLNPFRKKKFDETIDIGCSLRMAYFIASSFPEE
jgi:hypothetical protein